MKETDAAWLAGILDGEGTFLIIEEKKRVFAPSFGAQIAVVNTCLALVKRCQEVAGGCAIGPIGTPRPRQKPAYRWDVKRKKAGVVIAAVLPYLIAKREQAAILLHLIGQTNAGARKGQWGRKAASPEQVAWRRTLKLAVQALNHRGDSPVPAEKLAALESVRHHLITGETPP
jgi:hypothetical protein